MNGGKNGGRAAEDSAADAMVRLVATLETSLTGVVDGQRALRAEVRAIGGKVDTLAARIDELTHRVHRACNLATKAIDETAALYEAQKTLSRALDAAADFKVEQTARVRELDRAHATLERALGLVESRVRQVRDEVADLGFEREGE